MTFHYHNYHTIITTNNNKKYKLKKEAGLNTVGFPLEKSQKIYQSQFRCNILIQAVIPVHMQEQGGKVALTHDF
jgi:hypothetical protein